MVELEQQIVAWVDAETEGVDPVTPDEVLDGPSAHAPAPASLEAHRARRTPRRLALVAAIVIALAAAITVRATDHREQRPAARPRPTVTVEVPDSTWTLRRPETWTTAYATSATCKGVTRSSILIANRPDPVRQVKDDPCRIDWDEHDLHEAGFVGIEINHVRGTGQEPGGADTPRPLSLDGFEPLDEGAEEQHLFVVSGSDAQWALRVWIDGAAAPDDVEALRALVASVDWSDAGDDAEVPRSGVEHAPATVGPRMATILTCMTDRGHDLGLELDPASHVDGWTGAEVTWTDEQQAVPGFDDDHRACTAEGNRAAGPGSSGGAWPERSGPSQSAADAERDGVVPEVAAMALADRAEPTAWFATGQGTWAITKMPTTEGGCEIGDPEGSFGPDFICAGTYGEVVLVDSDGRVRHAYPMPEFVPTWIFATRDAIYAGRTGDGGLPSSSIVRIDRQTFAAEVIVFPVADPGAAVDREAAADAYLIADTWSLAPAGAELGDFVTLDDQPPGTTLAASWTGITAVDLPAIEVLFA